MVNAFPSQGLNVSTDGDSTNFWASFPIFDHSYNKIIFFLSLRKIPRFWAYCLLFYDFALPRRVWIYLPYSLSLGSCRQLSLLILRLKSSSFSLSNVLCSKPLPIEHCLQCGIIYELAERALHPTGQVINEGIEQYWSRYCATMDIASHCLSAGLCTTDHNTLSPAVCVGAVLKTLYARSPWMWTGHCYSAGAHP